MQELEKILEEMKKIKDGNRKENLYAKYPPKDEPAKILNGYSQGYEDGTDNFYNAMIDIICKHMENDGWIPVEETIEEGNLPKDGEYVMVSFWNFTMPDIARYEQDEYGGTFYPGDGERGYSDFGLFVNAWRPLPKPYRL